MGENLRTFDDLPAVVVVKPSQLEETLKAVVHTIIFHRAMGQVTPVEAQCSVVWDLAYVRCDDAKICTQVEQVVHSFSEDFKKAHNQLLAAQTSGGSPAGRFKPPNPAGAANQAGRAAGVRGRSSSNAAAMPPIGSPSSGAGAAVATAGGEPLHSARLELRFYDEEKRLWGYLNNKHYWERWIVPVELHPEFRCRAHPHAGDHPQAAGHIGLPPQGPNSQLQSRSSSPGEPLQQSRPGRVNLPPSHQQQQQQQQPQQQPQQQQHQQQRQRHPRHHCEACRRVEFQQRIQHDALRDCLVAIVQNMGSGIDHLSAIKEDHICFPFDAAYQDRRSGSKWFPNISFSGLKDFSAPNLTKMP